jgi:predicted LPLAT superfamily acyltransferase
MLETILRRLRVKVWRLRGYDTFAGESYPLAGIFLSERAAMRAARQHLKRLEKMQPSRFSGGQEGIQDHVYIVRPDGTMWRYSPKD